MITTVYKIFFIVLSLAFASSVLAEGEPLWGAFARGFTANGGTVHGYATNYSTRNGAAARAVSECNQRHPNYPKHDCYVGFAFSTAATSDSWLDRNPEIDSGETEQKRCLGTVNDPKWESFTAQNTKSEAERVLRNELGCKKAGGCKIEFLVCNDW